MVSVGICIGQGRLCIAELDLKGGRPRKLSFEELFPENSDSQKELWALLSQQLAKIKKRRMGQNLRFCYGIPQSFVTSFLVEFPFKEKFKILKTLPYEIEDKSPFRSNKVFFDARICQIKDKNKSSALCFVTPEEHVQSFIEKSQSLEKSAYLLSCEGSALANLLEFWGRPLSQPQNTGSLYIYLGVHNSQWFFYKNGHLQNVSVLDWSAKPIIKEMEKLYKLSEKKAWEEFFKKSFILTSNKNWTKEQVFFSNLIKKHIQLLIPQLDLLKLSLGAEQGLSISSAVLFGPGSAIKNLTAFLTAQVPVRFSRLQNLPDFPDFNLESHPSSCIALGLALEGLKRSPYSGLNFLRSVKRESFSFYPKKWKKLALVFGLCFFVWTLYSFVRMRESSKILDKVKVAFVAYGKKIARLPESQVHEESVKSFLKKRMTETESERAVRQRLKQPQPMDYLQKITQKLGSAEPWGLSIHYLKIDGPSAEIRGQVNRSSLEKFKSHIQNLAKGPVKEGEKGGLNLPKKNKIQPLVEGDPLQQAEALGDGHAPQKVFFSYSFQFKKEL